MNSRVRDTLSGIGAIDAGRLLLLSDRTRDREVPVWMDPVTGVIFVDDFYVGDHEYESGQYRGDPSVLDYQDLVDTRRRIADFEKFYYGRSILDFGCGSGSFLRGVRQNTSSVCGIELQTSFRDALVSEGIPCYADLRDVGSIDVAFMFHVLEHLPDPLSTLTALRQKISTPHGYLVVEVPHARDFLIRLGNRAFLDFTLWSQHLVLHTRDSLQRLLAAAGFTSVEIQAVQRYGTANHLRWLADGRPGGHREPFSLLESPDLVRAYSNALASMDATDTLIAIAR